jgi:signal transduction histidine kinase
MASEIYVNLAKSIKSSALLLLPSTKALMMEYELGVLDHLLLASKNNQVTDIRIICSIDDNNAQIIKRIYEEAPNIKVLNNRINLATKVFIVNDDTLFRAELRDPEADTFSKALSFATYSNSKPTVGAFRSFFELLWESNTTNEKLYEVNKKLQQTDKVQREFINIAAHELRTPIVPILNLSELLYSKIIELQQEGKQEEKEMLEMSEIILRNANRLHQLTEDILDVTRIESNTLKLRKERLNLNDVIVDAVQDCRRQIANSNVNVTCEPANNDSSSITLLVEADRRRLTQVVSNLLNNAIKFTQEGTVSVTISIIKRKEDTDRDSKVKAAEEVLIAVKDSGIGIDPELMPRLFTKFATKSYQGTGLGLFISKSIVEAHGGKMWALNNNDESSDSDIQHQGATFYFTMPVVSMTELRIGEEKEVRVIND